MRNAIIALLIVVGLSYGVGFSEFTLTTNRTTVTQNDVVTVNAVIVTDGNAQIITPTFPSSSDYQVLQVRRQGPSHQSSISIINGRRSAEVRFTYYYQYQIRFLREGSVTLPGLTTTIDGTTKSTQPIVFLVGSAGAQPKPLEVSFIGKKSGLYRGQRTNITIRIRKQARASVSPSSQGINNLLQDIMKQLESKVTFTSLNNWNIDQKQTTVNGVSYIDYEIPLLATVQDTGTITAGPFLFEYFKERSQGRDFFGQPMIQRVPATLRTSRLRFRVKSLPPAPKGFRGAMHPIKMRGNLEATSVAAGESVALHYTVSGKVAPNQLGEISLPTMRDVEIFTPEKHTNVDTTKSGIYSKKSYDYIISPNKEGTITIPKVSIPWFDTKSETYKYASAGPFTLEVTKGSGAQRATTRRYLTQEAIARVGDDIGAIKKQLSENDEEQRVYRNPLLQGAVVVPWILMVLLFILKIQQKYFPVNRKEQLQKQALHQALKALDMVARGKSTSSLVTIVEQYLSLKLSLDVGGLRRNELEAKLPATTTSLELLRFLESVEMARYGGGKSQEELLKEGKRLLKALDKEIN